MSKRRRSDGSEATASWRRDEEHDADLDRRKAGADLFKHLLGLYACCKITAKDFATACFFANEAGVGGADFSTYAVPPGKDSGRYQKALSAVLPEPGPFIICKTPQTPKGQELRQVVDVPISLGYERLLREVEKSPEILEKMDEERGICQTEAYACDVCCTWCWGGSTYKIIFVSVYCLSLCCWNVWLLGLLVLASVSRRNEPDTAQIHGPPRRERGHS